MPGQDVMQRVQSARASQSLRECDDILECADDGPAPQRPNASRPSRLSRPGSADEAMEDAISDMDADDAPAGRNASGCPF